MLTVILLIVSIVNTGMILRIYWLLRAMTHEINHCEMWLGVPPETFFK